MDAKAAIFYEAYWEHVSSFFYNFDILIRYTYSILKIDFFSYLCEILDSIGYVYNWFDFYFQSLKIFRANYSLYKIKYGSIK